MRYDLVTGAFLLPLHDFIVIKGRTADDPLVAAISTNQSNGADTFTSKSHPEFRFPNIIE